MFILKFKDGSQLNSKECKNSWDDVPTDKEIGSMQLTLPLRAHRKNNKGELEELPARTISISGYNRYYYSKEAVATVLVNGTPSGQPDKISGQHKGTDVAEIMGGIDDRVGLVFQVRVAKDGNISTRHFPISQLEYADHALRLGRPLQK